MVETFDLRPARSIRKRQLAAPRAIAGVGAVTIALVDAAVVMIRGLSIDDPLLWVQMGVSIALILFLIWATLFAWAPGPVALTITTDGMVFELASHRRLTFGWGDPALDLSVLDYTDIRGATSGRRQLVPMYLTGVGVGTWRPIALTEEAGTAILRTAQARNLILTNRRATGSMVAANLGPNETHIQGTPIALRHAKTTGVQQ